MKILKYTKAGTGALQGYLDLEVTKWGCMIIKNLRLFMKNGKRWISYPSEMKEVNGEKKYFPHIYFGDKDFRDKFEKAILDALDKYCLENAQKPPQPQNHDDPDGLPF